MIRPIDLPVVVSQAPLAQHLQFAAQSAPGAHQAFLSQLVIQKQQREMEQVAKTEKSEPGSNSVKDRESREESSHRQPDTRKPPEEEYFVPEQGEHIVNIKV